MERGGGKEEGERTNDKANGAKLTKVNLGKGYIHLCTFCFGIFLFFLPTSHFMAQAKGREWGSSWCSRSRGAASVEWLFVAPSNTAAYLYPSAFGDLGSSASVYCSTFNTGFVNIYYGPGGSGPGLGIQCKGRELWRLSSWRPCLPVWHSHLGLQRSQR